MDHPPTDTERLRSQVATLQEELNALRDRYDTLLEANNRAAARYKADYKKWRDFKRWLFRDAETDEHVRSFIKSDKLLAYARESALGKRKKFEEFETSLEHAARNDDDTKDPKQESLGGVKVDLCHSSPVAAASRYQRRKSYHGESSHKVLSPLPASNKDPFLVTKSAIGDDKTSVLDTEIPPKADHSRLILSTEPRKRKGRYAQTPSGMDTINSRFSIRKDNNHGVDFQYDAVVRSREERRHMLGSDCECCREYYEAVGPLPASRQPLWRTPTKRKEPCNLHPSNKENTDDVEEHKQLISRHRHHWHRPKTPPGYWDIGFPDTQEVLDINRRAAEMHKRKLIEVEMEAKNDNGRYVERAVKTS